MAPGYTESMRNSGFGSVPDFEINSDKVVPEIEAEMEQTNEKIKYEGTQLLNEEEVNSARLLLLQRLKDDKSITKNSQLLNEGQEFIDAEDANLG